MRYGKRFGTLALVIILVLLAVTIPATPALAASITLSPTTGEVGTTVTVSGSGFTAGHNIEIDFNWVFRTYITASPTGALSATFTVPDVAASVYQVQAIDIDTSLVAAVAYFTVISAEITIDLEEGPVGTEVEISGEGYDSREDIIIEYDGDEVDIESGDDETDSSGEFEDTLIIIPESTAGDHTITVIGDDSGIEAEVEFTVEPQIVISPTSGSAGTEVTVTGTGFGRRSGVTIHFNDGEVAISGDDDTDRDGSFSTTFSVPALTSGTYTVEAEDEDDNTYEVDFEIIIATSISIAPTSGGVGTEITVTGAGFSGALIIKYDEIAIATATAEASGAFSATFTVPVSARGVHAITVSSGTSTESTTFTVLTSASLNQTTGNVGTEITVTGTGFSGTVTIKYDEIAIATATAEASGAFSATFTAPASTGGNHTVTVSDSTSTIQTTFVMESEVPPAPALLLPEADSKVEEEVFLLDWKDVTDSSGVTYTFQIASDAAFTAIVLQKEGLIKSEYTLTEGETLLSTKKEAPYYWRAKAIDGASNESVWSTPRSFYVSFSFTLPNWAKYTLIGLGALLLGMLGFWLGRRTAYSSF